MLQDVEHHSFTYFLIGLAQDAVLRDVSDHTVPSPTGADLSFLTACLLALEKILMSSEDLPPRRAKKKSGL